MALPIIAILGPILIKAGAPILKAALEKEVGGTAGKVGSVVIDALSTALGVDPTPEAIEQAHRVDPVKTETIIKEVENGPEAFDFLKVALAYQQTIVADENTKGFFAWGWRPAMSWLVIFLFGWSMVLVPVVNAALHATVAAPSMDAIVQFSGMWLVIYGGGHTIKEVWGKK